MWIICALSLGEGQHRLSEYLNNCEFPLELALMVFMKGSASEGFLDP
jgi:hypothetical protein